MHRRPQQRETLHRIDPLVEGLFPRLGGGSALSLYHLSHGIGVGQTWTNDLLSTPL